MVFTRWNKIVTESAPQWKVIGVKTAKSWNPQNVAKKVNKKSPQPSSAVALKECCMVINAGVCSKNMARRVEIWFYVIRNIFTIRFRAAIACKVHLIHFGGFYKVIWSDEGINDALLLILLGLRFHYTTEKIWIYWTKFVARNVTLADSNCEYYNSAPWSPKVMLLLLLVYSS